MFTSALIKQRGINLHGAHAYCIEKNIMPIAFLLSPSVGYKWLAAFAENKRLLII